MDIDSLFHRGPFEMSCGEKTPFLISYLNILTALHREQCTPYRDILRALSKIDAVFERLEDFPFLPVRLFKEFELSSISDGGVVKTLTSSGTTSQKLSRIFLDKRTSLYQTKALVNILQDFVGKKRLPVIIVDCPSVLKDRGSFSARGAGIRGILNFATDHFYLLDDDMTPDFRGLAEFLSGHRGVTALMFGFTFMIWEFFCKALAGHPGNLDLSGVVLLHSGGWKKLAAEAVDSMTFKNSLRTAAGITRVHNFYGMVEQTGSIFMECENGYFHASNFSDIIIRDPLRWECAPFGSEGLIEVFSLLPHSYPGHILLTEDLGTILGEDNCTCGRRGKYFLVSGRIPSAEMRGCSDTFSYEQRVGSV